MRRAILLVPAWLISLWLLLASDTIWNPDSLGTNVNGESGTAGWMLLGGLVACSMLFALAHIVGRKVLMSSSSSTTIGLGSPNGLQEKLGAGLVRLASLSGLYLLVGLFWVEFA